MKVAILAGGHGTRLSEETELRPKPLVEIGGRPILWHIMKIYAAHGYREFVVALGYKGEAVKDYFLHRYHRTRTLTVDLGRGDVKTRGEGEEDWVVHLLDTGIDTQTGGRTAQIAAFVGDEPFMLTYGDGVAAIDITALVAFHRAQGRLATVTAVRPPARFGALEIAGDQVARFEEKPQLGEGWINGGFFVFEPGFARYLGGERSGLEHDALSAAARDGQLSAFKLDGYWQSMDTLREKRLLDAAWRSGEAPWKVWK
jgi:glucose-1-phosphate cytidylyltransferase